MKLWRVYYGHFCQTATKDILAKDCEEVIKLFNEHQKEKGRASTSKDITKIELIGDTYK